MRKGYIFFQAPSSLSEITIEHYRRSNTSFSVCRYWELDPHHIALIHPHTIYAAFPEPFRSHSGKSTQTWFRKQYGIHTDIPSILRLIPVQRHVPYSFYPWKKTATPTEFKLLLKFQMREVYTYIQLSCYWYSPWKTRAFRWSRLLLLTPDFSKLFSRADSNERRLVDGLATEKCFFL